MATPFRIGGLDHIVIRVRDMTRMVAFYRDVLDCPVEKVQDDLGLWQLRAGRTLIDFVDVQGKLGKMGGAPPGTEALNLDHFCLSVEPFDGEAIASSYNDAAGNTCILVKPRLSSVTQQPSWFDLPK